MEWLTFNHWMTDVSMHPSNHTRISGDRSLSLKNISWFHVFFPFNMLTVYFSPEITSSGTLRPSSCSMGHLLVFWEHTMIIWDLNSLAYSSASLGLSFGPSWLLRMWINERPRCTELHNGTGHNVHPHTKTPPTGLLPLHWHACDVTALRAELCTSDPLEDCGFISRGVNHHRLWQRCADRSLFVCEPAAEPWFV